MIITILAFGITKEILPGASTSFNFDKGTTVSDLKLMLEQQYPQLKALRSFVVAVNNEYAPPAYTIQAGDEIALIPPVSGG